MLLIIAPTLKFRAAGVGKGFTAGLGGFWKGVAPWKEVATPALDGLWKGLVVAEPGNKLLALPTLLLWSGTN